MREEWCETYELSFLLEYETPEPRENKRALLGASLPLTRRLLNFHLF